MLYWSAAVSLTATPSQPSLDLPLTPRQRSRGVLFLCIAVGMVGFTMMIQMAMNANFLADEIGVNGQQMGQVEAARETCGITAILLLVVLSGLAEPLVAVGMLVLVGVGLGSYAYVPGNYLWILVLSLVWSQGLHVWMPLPNSMALGLAQGGKAGRMLGLLAAVGALGSFCGLGVAALLAHWHVSMRTTYIFAGLAALLAAAACVGIPRNVKTPGPRLVFRRKYALYYLLCFLEGWRKQIFLAFSAFLLVKVYHQPLMTMLGLWGIVQAVTTFSGPIVGRAIDRLGERKVLYFYYLSMLVVFAGYAFAPKLWPDESVRKMALYVLFVTDGAFFILATALTTYVNRIAPQSEHTATLSAGVAMNHVAAVSMPFIGGILWQKDPMWTFLIGTVAAVASLVAATFIPRRTMPTP